MLNLAMMFQDGGPFMYVILLFGLTGGCFGVVWTVISGIVKQWIPVSIAWLGITLAVAFGLVGVFMGNATAASAAHASPEIRMTLIASGLATSMFTFAFSAMLGWLAFGAVSLLSGLIAAVYPGGDSSFSAVSAASAGGGSVLGAISATVLVAVWVGLGNLAMLGPSSVIIPVVACALAFGAFLSSLRDCTEPELKGRQAGARVAIGTAAVLSTVLVGTMFHTLGVVNAFMAVAHAAPEHKAELLTKGIEIASLAGRLGWSCALIPAFTAIGGGFHLFARIENKQGIGVAIGGLQAAFVLFAVIAGWSMITSSLELMSGAF